jgi:hypothetical protein
MSSIPIRDPDAKALAEQAFAVSGCRTHAEFAGLFGDAVGVDTFRKWLAGKPAAPIAKLLLREYVAGWRPGQVELRKDVGRAADLMEYAAQMINKNCPDATLVYDGVTCDGTCLHDDLTAHAEDLRTKVGLDA